MTRFRDWQSRLAALVGARLQQPFEWGVHDCALFAADAVKAVTGVDPAAELRGTYSTAAGAARVLSERGGLDAIATAALGQPRAPLMARPGDVGLVLNDGRECLGVCTGSTWHVPGQSGLVALPLADAVSSWKVG